jgi:molybdopterin-guanine dinucleotide biosynthesis protein A
MISGMKGTKSTGIVLASGEGSRLRELSQILGLPKHLFPLGDSTSVGRIAHAMAPLCQEVLCLTRQEENALFGQKLSALPFPVRIISKEQQGFRGDFLAAFQSTSDHIVLTVGDLIFPDGELQNFILRAQKKPEKIFLAIDAQTWKRFDFRIVAAALPKKFLEELIPLNPESFWSIFWAFLKNFRRVKLALVQTLFNLNTPEVYAQAKTYFEHH